MEKEGKMQEMMGRERETHFHHVGSHIPFGELVKPMSLDVCHDRETYGEPPKMIDPSKGQENLHQEIQKLTVKIGNLNLAMRTIQQQVRRTQGERAPRARNEKVQCYNCGEKGHYSPQCPLPRREPGGLYTIAPRQRNERNMNLEAPQGQTQGQPQGQGQAQTTPQFAVGFLETIEEGDEEDEADVLAYKRRRTQRSDTEEVGKEEKS